MLIFFYGENAYRIAEKTAELKNKFMRDVNPDGSAVYVIDAGTSDAKTIINICQDNTLFARKKMVIISNWSASKSPKLASELLKYGEERNLEKNEDVFVFVDTRLKTEKNQLVKIGAERNRPLTAAEKKFADWLLKSPYAQEIKNFTPAETLAWIKSELAKRDLKIEPAALNLLPALAGYDLVKLKNELNKLAAYTQGLKETTVTSEAIKLFVNSKIDPNIFALTDALGSRNHALAARLLEEQYASGAAPEYLSLMLGRHFRLLWRIKQAVAANKLASVKANPYVVKKGATQATRFTEAELRQASNSLLDLELAARQGRADLQTGLSLWLQRV
jgi:DNA polymerase-3 subunit delta